MIESDGYPECNGLYNPRWEHDACGVGAVVNVHGKPNHEIVDLGRQVLENLQHRGAAGSDESTGDGAGILVQIPDVFFRAEADRLKFKLPAQGRYAVAMVFGSQSQDMYHRCRELIEKAVQHHGLQVIGWRQVPRNNQCLGDLARAAEPVIEQLFIGGGACEQDQFERKLYLARKHAEIWVLQQFGCKARDFYICTMSSKTICYKGMFLAPQLFAYYDDLRNDNFVSSLAIVHQRYSTNTFPNWRLAQPFRCVAHNGEINTLSGNKNRMRAREKNMQSDLLGPELGEVFPILTPGGSDSMCFDNALELLVQAGRSMPHAMMMMIPEAFGARYHISADKRAFYEYHSSFMEAWDGPAAMVFTDGRLVGGTLDRNGLRPARYVVTNDGLVVLASEVGVIEFEPQRIRRKGRLQPGRMFLVDTQEGRIVTDNEIKSRISRQKPYRRWLEQNRIELRGLFHVPHTGKEDSETIVRYLQAFGYTREELQMLLVPMGADGQEPVGSMGTDTPLAVLSDKPKLLFNYFKQLFAQVTNPPIDPLREGLVMSLMAFTGKQQNLLTESPCHCRQLKLPHPILSNEDIERLKTVHRDDFKVASISAVFDAKTDCPGDSLKAGLDRLLDQAQAAVRDGSSLLIISDRDVSPEHAPIPSLLATAAVHHGLLNCGLRSEAGLVVESGEPREVMHFCLLCGYGANAVNPYLALEALALLQKRGDLPADMEHEQIIDNYINAVKKGILKTMSKMGISTLRSYHQAQLFEAVGVNRQLVDTYFTGTASRIGGADLDTIAREALARHQQVFGRCSPGSLELECGGEYQYRQQGENHLWNPQTVSLMQQAVRDGNYKLFREYTRLIDDQSRSLCTLRGLFEFVPGQSVPLDQVESAEQIATRFCTGAMSHGSISQETHETLAAAMNHLGAMSNTGEGGEDPIRYEKRSDGVNLNSAIKQIASGRFGVTIDYLAHAKMLQIKMAQGAKPGEGGQLPGHKVTDDIARLRYSTPGVTLISPPPHHDIYSIEDLAQLIYDLKCSNPGVKVSVKLVSEVGVGTIAAGVAKGNADEVLISGYDGGTGASPLSSIKHAGAPWELGLAETQQTLVLNNLRDRIQVQTDGQLKTGRDVVIGALLGAERFGFGTGALVSLGCVLMRKCHLGTCPVGIGTQDPELRKRFNGKPEYVENFMLFIARQVRELMAELGFKTFDEMVGRVDRLNYRKAINHYKAKGLDLSAIFLRPDASDGRAIHCVRQQTNTLDSNLDWKIIEQAQPAIERKEKTVIELPIKNVHRTVGAILSNKIVTRYGPKGLPDDTLQVVFKGSAGQSFGAFLAPGVTLRLIGDSNDYLGKGLSGGRIVVQTPPESPFEPHENIIVGNTLLYGATSGEVFINGLAGERFAVRNSGAVAVVEGLGDHGCEYMTNGVIVVLGQTGRNFAAGMSGGIAYVLDEHQLFDTLCNLDMVDLENVWRKEDVEYLNSLIQKHQQWTASLRAEYILKNWREMQSKFVKVIPIDYRKALARIRNNEQRQAEFIPATEEVFNG